MKNLCLFRIPANTLQRDCLLKGSLPSSIPGSTRDSGIARSTRRNRLSMKTAMALCFLYLLACTSYSMAQTILTVGPKERCLST